MINKSDERIEKLARTVVDSMTLDDVVSFVIERLTIDYLDDTDLFEEDWEFYFGE